MANREPRSVFEKLLYLGIATFILWPFVQLRTIKAVPLIDSDTHFRASIALENLMEESMSMPFDYLLTLPDEYKPFEDASDISMKHKVVLIPHSFIENTYLLQASVSWGKSPFIKELHLEKLWTKRKP